MRAARGRPWRRGRRLQRFQSFWYSQGLFVPARERGPARIMLEEHVVKTHVPKRDEIDRKWVVIDAEGKVLGRVASKAASLLRGKHKPEFTPYLECGDYVIIVNAAKARVTGNKYTQKRYYRHSGYPGGISSVTFEQMSQNHPTRAMTLAVNGMLPKNRLGRSLARHLRVYAGADHPHQAQQPVEYSVD